MVSSGKEVVIDVGLKQSIYELETFTVTSEARKESTGNTMSSVSARSFSVEETQRYAGGLDDPAGMASSFAGVPWVA